MPKYLGTTVTDEQMVTAKAISQALCEGLRPYELDAAPLFLATEMLNGLGMFSTKVVMYLGPRISAAIAEADRVSEQSRRLIERCLNSGREVRDNSQTIPDGF